MIDIVSATQGLDLGLFDTQAPRAANILSVQLGRLEYAPEVGIDLKYFLSETFTFQNDSFKSYLVEVLANNSINVASVVETLENIFTEYDFNLSAQQSNTGLVAR